MNKLQSINIFIDPLPVAVAAASLSLHFRVAAASTVCRVMPFHAIIGRSVLRCGLSTRDRYYNSYNSYSSYSSDVAMRAGRSIDGARMISISARVNLLQGLAWRCDVL